MSLTEAYEASKPELRLSQNEAMFSLDLHADRAGESDERFRKHTTGIRPQTRALGMIEFSKQDPAKQSTGIPRTHHTITAVLHCPCNLHQY